MGFFFSSFFGFQHKFATFSVKYVLVLPGAGSIRYIARYIARDASTRHYKVKIDASLENIFSKHFLNEPLSKWLETDKNELNTYHPWGSLPAIGLGKDKTIMVSMPKSFFMPNYTPHNWLDYVNTGIDRNYLGPEFDFRSRSNFIYL